MKSWGRLIFIAIAYSVALVHTAIPHQHHATSGRTPTIATIHCITTSSVSGLLEMVFSTDLGQGHLETFQKSTSTTDDRENVASVLVVGLLNPLQISHATQPTTRKGEAPPVANLNRQYLLLSAAGFRAPPVST